MSKPGFHTHQKFLRLRHLLGERTSHVAGYCELLLQAAHKRLGPVVGDEVDVELAADYGGPPGKLAEALLAVGLLDRLPDGRLAVHDYWDHAPRWVQKKRADAERAAQGRPCARAGCPRAVHSSEAHAKYCGDACRKADHRARKAQAKAPPDDTPGAPLPRNGDVHQGPVVTLQAPEAPVPKEKPKKFDPAALPLPPGLDSQGFARTWRDWCAHLAAKKKPMTQVGAERALKKCLKLGEAAAVEALDEAMAAGWQGFAFKDRGNGSNGNGSNGSSGSQRGHLGRLGRCEAPEGKYDARRGVLADANDCGPAPAPAGRAQGALFGLPVPQSADP